MPLTTPARPCRTRATPFRDAFHALTGLLHEPDDDALAPLVQALADRAASAPTRKMGSVQALLREHGGGLPPEVRERLVVLAQTELARRDRDQVALPVFDQPATSGTWYSIKEAAPRLGLREDVLTQRLRNHADRRRLGYPRWDGYQWWISSLAIDPATSAAFLATLPAHEGVPELLPDWCTREGQDRAPREAHTDDKRLALRWPKLDPGAS
jgi:hypothetical protein